MPRVTISINAPNDTVDQDLLVLDLPPGLAIKDLKGFVEAESGFPATAQTLFLNGAQLNVESQTLEQAGIHDGEMLAVLIRRPGNATQGPRTNPTRDRTTATNDPRAADPEMVRLHMLNDPSSQQQLRERSPNLLAALHDPVRWRQEFDKMRQEEQSLERQRQEQIALLNADPFNLDAQKKIEEIIRQERVWENLQHAYDNNPEVFARVHMLYINTEVNGHPVKAFVDSGAQATIMSPDCAERCGIMRLIDKRYAGIAKGVGTANILGRVHHAEIKIGGAIMPCAFTVMEGKDVDLLFGLDMLKRYKAKIDLEKNALCFEGIEVPFLAEHEIPKSLEEAQMNEPTVPGPNGTEIGTESGAVTTKAPTGEAGPSTQPQQAPTQSRQPTAPQAQAAEFPPEHIEQLVNLGFSRQASIQALQATGGNVEYAAGLLFSNV